MSLISELKRRNVVRVGATYVALAWLIIQVAETVLPLFSFDERIIRSIVIALALGFIPALLLAWFFEWTSEGVVAEANADHDSPGSRRRAGRLDRLLVVALLLGLGLFAWDKFVLEPGRDAHELEVAREQALAEGRAEARNEIRDTSIAVLPFEDLSGAGDLDYFCEGLAEDIINDLAKIARLRVTARTSAFSFKTSEATAAAIGEALNVAHILEGSVSQSGQRVRIAVQLVDAASQTTLWSEQYDRTLDDIFEIRDDISEKVVARLPIRDMVPVSASLRTDPKAYALTLRARTLLHSGNERSGPAAKTLIEEALAIDPDYIPALLELIYVNYALIKDGKISKEEESSRGEEIVTRILALDPDNAMALTLEAFDSWETDNNWEEAAGKFAIALAAEPGNVEIIRLAGQFARRAGQADVAVALLEQLASLDPLYVANLFQLPQAYLSANRYKDAISWFEVHDSVRGGAQYYHAMALLLLDLPGEALAVVDAGGFPDADPQNLAMRAMASHSLGDGAARDRYVTMLESVALDSAPYGPYLLAQAHAWVGNSDAAFDWIDTGLQVDTRGGVTGWWFRQILFLPIWEHLHDDPRWSAARARVGMSAQRMDAIELDFSR